MNRLGITFVSVIGLAGLAAWLMLFAAGLSIDSKPYRDIIAPASPGGAGAATVADRPAGEVLWALAMTTALYTPLNAALLTILAALIGGSTSFLTYAREPERKPRRVAPLQRLVFLTEVPFASMMRGFLVYVAAIAGIYITTDNPFDSTTPAQYVRVVGLLSFVGFVVGYDPTRVEQVIAKLPGATPPAEGAGDPSRPPSPPGPAPGP